MITNNKVFIVVQHILLAFLVVMAIRAILAADFQFLYHRAGTSGTWIFAFSKGCHT